MARESELLRDLLEVCEQRDQLQSMLAKDKARYQKEDAQVEAQMQAKILTVTQWKSSSELHLAVAQLLLGCWCVSYQNMKTSQRGLTNQWMNFRKPEEKLLGVTWCCPVHASNKYIRIHPSKPILAVATRIG